MAAPRSPYPQPLSKALQEASSRLARRLDILIKHEADSETPFQVALRNKSGPQKQIFHFPDADKAKAFLDRLASLPV